MRKLSLWIGAIAVVFAATGCVDREAQKQSKATEKVVSNPVKAVTVLLSRVDSVDETVEITGDVTAGQDTTIGSKQNNRVVAVYVKDGDSVSQGQLLATMDDTSANAQLKQAEAQVATAVAAMSTARSQVMQATRNLEVGPHKSTIEVTYAQAQVLVAQRNYDRIFNGARPEERHQSEANLASAKANLDLQQKQLDRIKALVAEGALAGQNLDQQQALYDQAQAQYTNAKDALKLIQEGNRVEDIDGARASLQAAKENLKTAQDQKRLDPLLKDQLDSAMAQVESARAQLDSARAQVEIAKQAVEDTKVFAPFAGKVSGKPIQAGTVAGANTAIVRIIGGDGVYFNGQMTSENVDRVHVGDPVSIHVDGIPNQTFDGKIASLNPQGDSIGRLFSARVQFTNYSPNLKPGMFARGSITIRRIPGAIVVPLASILSKDDKNYVFIVENGKAKQVFLTLGLPKGNETQVIGLPAGAKVVTSGQDTLTSGDKVEEKASTTVLNTQSKSSEAKG